MGKGSAALILLALPCAGCGQTAPVHPGAPAVQVPQVPAVPAPGADAGAVSETEDHVLTTREATVDGGRTLTLETVWKKQADMDLWGVWEVRISEGDVLLQAIPIQEAIDAGDMDGIGTGYTACWSAEEAMSVLDMNFDGSKDLDLVGWIPASNTVPHYHWMWDSGAEAFSFALCLQGASVDETAVIATYQYENGVDYPDHYAPDETGALVLEGWDVMDWSGSGETPVVESYEMRDGRLAPVL